MGKRRAESAFEDNPVINGFLEWMDAPGDNSRSRRSILVFDALEHAGVDARQRKIVWADGKRLSIEQSAKRIHAGHPGVPRDLIETHVLGWLESCAPASYSERQLDELDRLIEPWLDDYERTAAPAPAPESSRELGTLEKREMLRVNPIGVGEVNEFKFHHKPTECNSFGCRRPSAWRFAV